MSDTTEKFKKIHQFISLFTDREWDTDLTKVLGFFIILAGLTGFFLNKSDFQWVIGFGATLVATGKFSKEG